MLHQVCSHKTVKATLASLLNDLVHPLREQLLQFNKKLQLEPAQTVLFPDILSLKKGSERAGKSDPEGTIFVEDSEASILEKIKKAYWPQKASYQKKKFVNPCMDYFKNIVFASFPEVKIDRTVEHGGNLCFTNYQDLEDAYLKGDIFPADLKTNLVTYINELVRPVREHFETNPEAKALLEQIKEYRVSK